MRGPKKPSWGAFKPPKRTGKLAPIKDEWPKNFMMTDVNRGLALTALERGVCLAFDYHGCHRIVGVFTVGLTQANRPAMSAWQVDGQSNEISIPGWGTFCFDECFNVALSDRPAPPAPADYRKGAKNFSRIDREF